MESHDEKEWSITEKALIKALDDRITEYVNEGWSFDCSYVWAVPVNPGNLLDSAIEVRISEWDLVYIVTADGKLYQTKTATGASRPTRLRRVRTRIRPVLVLTIPPR